MSALTQRRPLLESLPYLRDAPVFELDPVTAAILTEDENEIPVTDTDTYIEVDED
jgi:hypothetical protein